MEKSRYKVIFYVKDIQKPIVLTFSAYTLAEINLMIESFRSGERKSFTTENEDIVYLNPNDVRCIMITKA